MHSHGFAKPDDRKHHILENEASVNSDEGKKSLSDNLTDSSKKSSPEFPAQMCGQRFFGKEKNVKKQEEKRRILIKSVPHSLLLA